MSRAYICDKLISFVWILQKLFIRIRWTKLLIRQSTSTRISEFSGVHTIFLTEDPLPYLSYKTNDTNAFRKVVCVQNAKLNPKTGVVWRDNQLLIESSVWDVKDLKKWEPNPKIYIRLRGTFKSLPDNGYFHFLIEDLPRFIEVHQWDRLSKTILGSKSLYLKDAIEFLDPTNYLLISGPARVDKLYLSEKITGKLFSDNDLALLRSPFSTLLNESGGRKIFISRRDSGGDKFSSRGVFFKQDIEDLFMNFQFEILYMEDLNLLDQVRISSSCSIIAGFHGAGLANIVWAKKGCKVIEITNNRITNHFKYISNICGHTYMRFSVEQPFSELKGLLESV